MSTVSYVNEINSIEKEIKRLTDRLKQLRMQKKIANEKLCSYMSKYNLESIGDGKNTIYYNKIQPKSRKKTKPKKDRKEESVKLFRDMGIPDPLGFFDQLELIKISNDK